MKRRIHGLSETAQPAADALPDGVFLVRVDRAQYRWHPAKPFYILRLSILEPHELAGRVISGRVYCTAKALWKLGWFLRDFVYDPDLLGREEVDEKALSGLRGVVKISHTTLTALPCSPSTVSLQPASGRNCPSLLLEEHRIRGGVMTYSYTQISQYLSCPRRYRYRYLDGWKEKDTRAAMLFGRAFDQALSAYFQRDDSGAVLFHEWATHKDSKLEYSNGTTWDRMLQQGIQLLERFAQDDRVRVRQPRKNLQVKFTRSLPRGNDFVAYVDAIGHLDGTRCLLEWKTTSIRYPEEPPGLLMLDPQLICYSWITGISDVAEIVFVRKRLVEIQYFRTTITAEQREEFDRLVDDTIRRIESAQFLPHSGVRFPQNPCTSCPYVGLCLGQQELVDTTLVRRPGDDLGLFDELTY